MKKRTIFQQRSQELMQIYEEAGNSKKVLVVAMDYAKKEHTVMFCNGNGDILRKPFGVGIRKGLPPLFPRYSHLN